MDYLRSVMDANFLPHGHCFLWTTDIFWLHLIGDLVTATAYYLIPVALLYFVIKSKHLPYPGLFLLFGVFILTCGTTHILGIVTLWHPVYRLEGLVKAATAMASIGTAVLLFPVIPKALRLRSPEELERLNRDLEAKNRELEAGRESFRNIVERNKEGILVIGEERKIVFANQASCEYLDCRRENLVGTTFQHALEDGEMSELEAGTDGGGRKAAEMWVSETQWDGRPAHLVHFRDISSRKQAEEALRKSQEQLQQAQKMEAIGRLAGGIAHDFNNLLTAINGFTSLALAKLPEGGPVREELVEVAKAGERASQLTGQLLAFSRKQILAPQSVDLNRVVEGISSMIRRIIGEDIRLATRPERGLSNIIMDPGQLEQIILNLAVNARDAMPAGGELILETSRETVAAGMIGAKDDIKAGDYAVLSVSDKGVGMTPEIKDRLFEPFFTTKEPGKGTGLGLSMVYGIVKQSEGHILVYSEPGKGSTFRLYFPLAAQEGPREEPEPSPMALSGNETILLVEDEGPVRKLVSELLASAGYTVIQADDGEVALVKAKSYSSNIDLLLTDVIMRNMGGSALSLRMLEMRPGTRILFMSGYTDDALVQSGVLNASYSFIQKPFSPSQILSKVRHVLDAPSGSGSSFALRPKPDEAA